MKRVVIIVMVTLFSPLNGAGREHLSYRNSSQNFYTHRNGVIILGISGEESAAWLSALKTLAQPEEKKAPMPMEFETERSNSSVRSAHVRTKKIVCCSWSDCLKLCCCVCLPKRGD